ncbi:MAG: hypothetical protein FWG87_14830 [Defluviitaleaceae bacterium]|nr:hypothetical protein [Defluviitaleaceae bacterium]
MANSTEKMRVLDLLESGKISAADASQLLSALSAPRLVNKETRESAEEKLRQFAQDCNRFAKDAGCKMQEMYKDVEPKVKKASKSALEKAASALDTLATKLGESLDSADIDESDVGGFGDFDEPDEPADFDEPREN